MKHKLNKSARRIAGVGLLCLIALSLGSPAAHAGLSLEMNMYLTSQGQTYVFYTPLTTNAIAPAAAVGTYIISSPGWPASGSRRGFEMTTTNVLIDRTEFDSEYGYGDFNSALQQITNGSWTILFTNAVSTNLYTFSVSAPNFTSNMLPATVITFPLDGSRITTSQTNFTWQGPANWPVSGFVYVTGPSYFDGNNFPASATNWTLPNPPPVDTGYSFNMNFVTNFVSNIFNVSTPTNNIGGAPISGWTSTAVISSGSSVSFDVFEPGAPSSGHTNLAYYSFEDDSLFAQDFSGHGNNINSYGNYSMPPYITNDAAAGSYALGSVGDGWLYPPTNLLATLAGSFTVSLWLRTSDVHGNDSDGQYTAAGIVSAFNGSGNDVMPMGLTGGKLAFYTGGSPQNLLHSQASINTGQYVHVVVTRDQPTGEKKIYINGALDSSVYASTNLLTGADGLSIGYNNGQTFTGDRDEIQFYAGVLSGDEVAYLYSHPGTNVADTVGVSLAGGHKNVAHYTFDNSGNLGQDSSGNGNNMPSLTYWGPQHQFAADAEAGGGAVQFFGTSYLSPLPTDQALTNLNAVLAGSFTFSAWVKTTVTNGTDGNNAYFGAVIFWAYNDHGNTNDTIPLAITGSKAAFTTRDHLGNNNTLHSLTSVNDGNYHLITVTRDQGTGEKKIYVDGNFETSEIGTTDPLNGNNYNLTIGGFHYIIDDTGTNYSSYRGLLDDVQIYSGVLSGDDVAYLYANPGSNVLDTAGSDFNTALNTTSLAWNTGGDSSWFVETTNTHDNVSAAQSGNVTGNQSSTLSVTVTGPGTLDFYWSSFAEDPNRGFDYEFDIDGVYANDISGDTSWVQDGPYQVGSGQHTFTWTTHANGDTDPTQAGFLDQVSFVNSGVPLTFSLMVIRQTYASYQPFVTGQTAFFAFPGLSGSDTPISYHRVESPNNDCSANFGPTNGGAGASILLTFDELANSLTNGNWKLWLNKSTPQEQLYTFTVNAFAFSSNSLAPVLIIVPLDGASAVATNTPYQWTGPNNWSNLTTQAWLTRSGTNFYYASANLPVTTVSWPAGPTLLPGTNFFYVEYDEYNVTNFVVGSPYPEWSVGSISYQSGATAGFLVSGITALPATLLNPKNNNTNFQFQFLSQAGYTHAVQYRTNLVKGSNWQTYSNVTGDGTLKTIPIPLSVFNPSKQGFVRVLSQ